MSDQSNDYVPANPEQISLEQEAEVKYWTDLLGVSPGELQRIVAKVGPGVQNVRNEIGNADFSQVWRLTEGD